MALVFPSPGVVFISSSVFIRMSKTWLNKSVDIIWCLIHTHFDSCCKVFAFFSPHALWQVKNVLFCLLGIFKCQYFYRDKNTARPLGDSLSKCPVQPGLGQATARMYKFNSGFLCAQQRPSTGAVLCCLLGWASAGSRIGSGIARTRTRYPDIGCRGP